MNAYHTPFHPSALPAKRRRVEDKHSRRARAAQSEWFYRTRGRR